MKSQQDQILTHQLPKEMALDSHGRVLRRPFFVTKEEHDLALHANTKANVRLLMAQREKVLAAESRATEAEAIAVEACTKLRDLAEVTINNVVIVEPSIFVRRRFHRVVRWLIRVDQL